MGSETPIRNQFGTIVGLQPKEETDQVKATLDASMQAVGAMPEVAPPTSTPTKRPLPPPPSLRIEIITAVLVLVAVVLTFLSRGSRTPAPIHIPTVTVAPTSTPQPTTTPTNIVPVNPRAVTLSAVVLYGDYDETTKIGAAPVGIVCVLAGQSPDGNWAYLDCPAPTGKVWAKVGELGLSVQQRDALLDTCIVSRIVPTSFPSAPQASGLAFCADRSSIWGTTHQCASSQAAADALADSDMKRIDAAAEALRNQR